MCFAIRKTTLNFQIFIQSKIFFPSANNIKKKYQISSISIYFVLDSLPIRKLKWRIKDFFWHYEICTNNEPITQQRLNEISVLLNRSLDSYLRLMWFMCGYYLWLDYYNNCLYCKIIRCFIGCLFDCLFELVDY